jgi:hypothetical protein
MDIVKAITICNYWWWRAVLFGDVRAVAAAGWQNAHHPATCHAPAAVCRTTVVVFGGLSTAPVHFCNAVPSILPHIVCQAADDIIYLVVTVQSEKARRTARCRLVVGIWRLYLFSVVGVTSGG